MTFTKRIVIYVRIGATCTVLFSTFFGLFSCQRRKGRIHNNNVAFQPLQECRKCSVLDIRHQISPFLWQKKCHIFSVANNFTNLQFQSQYFCMRKVTKHSFDQIFLSFRFYVKSILEHP